MKLYVLFLSVLLIIAVFKECHVIPLETNNDSFIRKIIRIYKTNDEIFILDKTLNKLSIFNIHGNYRHSCLTKTTVWYI